MQPIVALLGRRDTPTDGVEDYCAWLGRALAERGHHLERLRVPWKESGWLRALPWLWQEIGRWRGGWVVVQYTALSWSRRGFPFYLLLVLTLLRCRRCRVAVVFHDSTGFPGDRWFDRMRRTCQQRVMRMAYHASERTIHNVPVDRVGWLPPNPDKAVHIPVGANIPAAVEERKAIAPAARGEKRTVAVFCVTGAQHRGREVTDIAYAVQRAAERLWNMRLIVLGRGSSEAEGALRQAVDGANVDLSVLGLLPADEVSRVLTTADVQLFVRGPFSSQRTSGIAGIGCRLPVVGYAGPQTGPPLTEAGVMLVPYGDREALAEALVQVLSNDRLWQSLHRRSVEAYRRYFSWDAIAERFIKVLRL